MILFDNEIFYLEGELTKYGLYIYYFHINEKYRGLKLSYNIWKYIKNKYKVDINLQAYFTLIPYYKKMGFIDLGLCDDLGYHDLILKYNEKNL